MQPAKFSVNVHASKGFSEPSANETLARIVINLLLFLKLSPRRLNSVLKGAFRGLLCLRQRCRTALFVGVGKRAEGVGDGALEACIRATSPLRGCIP